MGFLWILKVFIRWKKLIFSLIGFLQGTGKPRLILNVINCLIVGVKVLDFGFR